VGAVAAAAAFDSAAARGGRWADHCTVINGIFSVPARVNIYQGTIDVASIRIWLQDQSHYSQEIV